MIKRVTAIKARQNLGQLLEEVYYNGDRYIIERAGKPMAAVVPVQVLEAQERRWQRMWTTIEDIWRRNRHVKPEQIEREVAAAVRAVRREAARKER